MSSYRMCTSCGRRCEKRGASRCDACSYRWTKVQGQLGWDWTKIRNAYIKDHPACEWEGCSMKAVTVDHILARAFGGTHDMGNLRSLCREHARVKDAADQREGMRRKAGLTA